MSTQVTVTLTDEIYHRAARLARLVGRSVDEMLADTIALSLSPLHPSPESVQFLMEDVQPASALADDKVLELVDLEMDAEQDQRLSLLLDRQQAALLTDLERSELFVLMQIYQEGLLRKAQALHEAVERGLREPLEP